MFLEYVEKKANDLLKELDLFQIPINVFLCAESLGVDMQEVDMDFEISGLFVFKNQKPYIRYNIKDQNVRQRFTIAHELGHYLLHSENTNLFIDKQEKIMYRDLQSSTGAKLMEREANAFAAALLMPKDLVIENANNLSDEYSDAFVYKLAQIFQVSEQAMGIRLSNLGLLEFGLF